MTFRKPLVFVQSCAQAPSHSLFWRPSYALRMSLTRFS